jgi:hypothetical protein
MQPNANKGFLSKSSCAFGDYATVPYKLVQLLSFALLGRIFLTEGNFITLLGTASRTY